MMTLPSSRIFPDLSEKQELYILLKERERRQKTSKLLSYYPNDGPLRRELYVKHLEFFRAGLEHRERLFLAANRVGKSEGVGGYEVALHLTGNYPDWWEGRRFTEPVSVWAAGDTSKTTRDILQHKLLGPVGSFGTGLIPEKSLGKILSKPGVPDAVELVQVRHASGGESTLSFKSYDQRREAYQGTEQDVIWLDEEPPFSIYSECLIRTMTTNGLILCTFTPLLGLSDTVLHFLPSGQLRPGAQGNKYVVMATWDDAPHLNEEAKAELWNSIPVYQRDARTRGIPQLGSGAIYPVAEQDIVVAPFAIPEYWPRCFGMDVGWNRTAAIWGAWDMDSDTVYLYSEHYQGQAEPAIHAAAIRARGEWIPGAIDKAARGRNQIDGLNLLSLYTDLGLTLLEADNAVEAGIYAVWMRLSTGRLKVFNTLERWLQEYRIYRRNEDGKVVKDHDHLMDATRYMVMSGLSVAVAEPYFDEDDYRPMNKTGRSPIGGY